MKISTFENLTWNGRYLDNNSIRYINYSASGFSFIFTGKKVVATFVSDAKDFDENNKAVIGVFVTEAKKASLYDLPEEPTFKYTLTSEKTECLLFESNEAAVEKTVCITVMKFSEAAFASVGLESLDVEGTINTLETGNSESPSLKIEFVGDSITCGYGIEGEWGKDVFTTQKERPDKAFAITTAKIVKAQASLCSWSGIGLSSSYVDPATINLPDVSWLMGSVWPYTDKSLSLRLGIEPEVWCENKFSPDIVVVNIGTNDISWVRGIEDRRLHFCSAYRQLLEAIHRRSPNAKICCCIGVMGESLNTTVQEAVDLFKTDFSNVIIDTVFFTEQDPADGIGTDWHPSVKTHKKIAEKLAEKIRNL